MRFSNLFFVLAATCLATVRPVYAEETVSGPVYLVTYFEVAPGAAAQGAAAGRQYAEASRKENGNGELRGVRRGHPPQPVCDPRRSGGTRTLPTPTTQERPRPRFATSFNRC